MDPILISEFAYDVTSWWCLSIYTTGLPNIYFINQWTALHALILFFVVISKSEKLDMYEMYEIM